MRLRLVHLAPCLALAGCGLQLPAAVQRDSWTGRAAPTPQPEFHLVVLWKRPPSPLSEPPAGRPELLAQAVAREFAAKKLGKALSYQVADDPAELEPFLSLWRPETPVLWVEAERRYDVFPSSAALSLKARARFQPELFDTSPDVTTAEAKVAGNNPVDLLDGRRRWLADAEVELAARSARELGWKLRALKPSAGTFLVYPGSTEGAKRAFALARAGDWPGAAGLWEAELARNPDDVRTRANLSIAHEMAGDLGKALEHQAGFDSRRWGDWLAAASTPMDRLAMLRGLAALRRAPRPAKPLFASRVAVLPFENETTDLQADPRVRKEVFAALERLGLALVPLDEVDAVLKRRSFTQAGQLKAAKPEDPAKWLGADYLVGGTVEEFRVLPWGVYFRWEVKAKLSLLRADASPALERTCHVLREERPDKAHAAGRTVKHVLDLLWRKGRDAVLADESRALAEQFTRPFPHLF